MRLSCYNRVIWIVLFAAVILHAKAMPSVAFYYGTKLSDSFVERFDWVVVDPDVIDPIWIARYPRKLFAYVSLGEYEAWRHRDQSPAGWQLGKNSNWNSQVMDLRVRGYRDFLLKKMQRLHERGYRNFFLDTLDSAFGKCSDAAERTRLKEALSGLIRTIRKRFGDAKLIANRGVEVMDTLCGNVDAFAIESLYKGIDGKTKAYRDVPQEDRDWVSAKLERAKTCGLVPIVIDYLPADRNGTRHVVAEKIAKAGYVPYVTDRYLQGYGEGVERPVKREVLLLYDSRSLKDGDRVYADVHLMASMPLEHLGYIPILRDIKDGLPDAGVDRYSGVILWPGSYQSDASKLFAWSKKWIDAGQKILFLNSFGFPLDPSRATALGLRVHPASKSRRLMAKVVRHDPLCGIEIPPLVESPDQLIEAPHARALIEARTDAGETFTPAAITPWGGYAVYQSATRDIGREPMWSIDPFAFFKAALQTPPRPIPDPTTENGRRELFIHIDGDGFIEKARFAPKMYASQILYRDILQKYPFPHSISVIEGEIGPKGLYPALAPKMERIARKIFRLPQVEIASHSYSHPFKWQKAEAESAQIHAEGGYHLPIPGYRFDLNREINGSVRFIDRELAPRNKRCKLFFWTGDCLPREDALRLTEQMQLGAINGGDTTATREAPWLGRVAPFGLQRGPFWQIYVGMQNENIYTNDWQGPFWGYRKVLETFAITDRPRRLKPLDIYYHFYSASKTASLDALKRVYDHVSKMKTLPLFTSEYIAIAHDFYATSITSADDGSWQIRNHGALRTLRIPLALGYPDLLRSQGVVGYTREGPNPREYYLHLDGSGTYRLYFQPGPPKLPYLISANGRVTGFDATQKRFHLKLQAHMPVEARLHLPKSWKIVSLSRHTKKRIHSDSVTLRSDAKTLEVTLARR